MIEQASQPTCWVFGYSVNYRMPNPACGTFPYPSGFGAPLPDRPRPFALCPSERWGPWGEKYSIVAPVMSLSLGRDLSRNRQKSAGQLIFRNTYTLHNNLECRKLKISQGWGPSGVLSPMMEPIAAVDRKVIMNLALGQS
jgi:hypothetical protein